jgi:hypothetical protein
MDTSDAHREQQPPKGRLILGGTIFVVGFLGPALVPLVAASGLSDAWKTGLSGFLIVGLPELFMLVAVAILGRPGFDYLKQRLWQGIKPPDTVSPMRYRIGLVLFCLPLLAAWADPYFSHLIPLVTENRLWFGLVGDSALLISLYVLGGEFWDKLAALFTHEARVIVGQGR